MKKYIALGLALVIMFALAACGGSNSGSAETQTTGAPETTAEPTAGPTAEPTTEPTAEPAAEPTEGPAAETGSKVLVPFCTSASSGVGSSAENLHSSVSESANWLDGTRFSGGASESDITSWLSGLGLSIG